jgi:GNAT superfamily N-acetyltransferase
VTHTVREATVGDAEGVIRLLDAAMLEVDGERTRDRVRAGKALVAVVRGHSREERRASTDADTTAREDRIVGACIVGTSSAGPREIEQIAVHRSRRARGIGTTLVDAAATRTDGPLVARFREDVRPFYESLGFEIHAAEHDGSPADSDDGDDGDDGAVVDSDYTVVDSDDGAATDNEDDAATDDEDDAATDSHDDPGADRLRGVLR